MKSIRVYEVASKSEENARKLHLSNEGYFYWSSEAFGNVEVGDGIFVINNQAQKAFFCIVEKINISSSENATGTKFKDQGIEFRINSKDNGRAWGLFTRLRITKEVSTKGELNMHLLQKKIFILYKPKKNIFTKEKRAFALQRINLLQKYFSDGIIGELLKHCILYFNSIVEQLPLIPVKIRDEQITIGNPLVLPTNKKEVSHYLVQFSKEANEWFDQNSSLNERYAFFKDFFKESNLKNATWKEFQLVGKNLQSFNYNRLRLNAWGRNPSHSISHYRKAFAYMAQSDDPIDLKLEKLLDKNGKYHLQHMYATSLTELIMYAMPNKYFFYNKRNEKVLKHLNIGPKHLRGEPFWELYKKYSEELEYIKIRYAKIVGKRTGTTFQLEIDQFLNWYYEKNIKPTEGRLLQIQHNVKSRRESQEEMEYVAEAKAKEEVGNIEITDRQKKWLKKYSDANAEAEVFIPSLHWNRIKNVLLRKKNIILQGPPGVGKTYAAKRLAYNILGEIDRSKVEVVQFHQSYSYEDFIQGIRPTEDGGFRINGGSFYNFCEKALENPHGKHFFIIEEINRGNLARVFGELMLLIEEDKRGSENAITLTYSKKNETFYVPENLYIIGTMNTADRSLSIVDYALRRRFSFLELEPSFDEKFKAHLLGKGVKEELIAIICKRITNLNKTISQDEKKLGKGFRVGHSYFCTPTADNHEQWYKDIIELEIQPLLEEYWFDESKKVSEHVRNLLGE